MKEIKKQLGLHVNASEKQVVAAIQNLQKENESYKKENEDYKEQIEDAASQIVELDHKMKSVTKELEAALLKIEELKTQKARGAISKKEIDGKVKQYFKHNKEVREIFITEDGTIFNQLSFAEDHKRTIGGLVHKYTQK